jgi:hypothetical protein
LLKIKLSSEHRKIRIFFFLFQGITLFLLSGFGVFMILFKDSDIILFPIVFLAISILDFWIAWLFIKLPSNS